MNNHLFRNFDFIEDNDEKFRASKLTHNILRIKTIAVFMIVYELWIITVNIIAIKYAGFTKNIIWHYFAAYFVMLVLCGSFIYIFRHKSEVYSKSLKSISRYEAKIGRAHV